MRLRNEDRESDRDAAVVREGLQDWDPAAGDPGLARVHAESMRRRIEAAAEEARREAAPRWWPQVLVPAAVVVALMFVSVVLVTREQRSEQAEQSEQTEQSEQSEQSEQTEQSAHPRQEVAISSPPPEPATGDTDPNSQTRVAASEPQIRADSQPVRGGASPTLAAAVPAADPSPVATTDLASITPTVDSSSPRRRRQMQYQSSGGTRIHWILDPEFSL